jgi:dihydrofolate reductase
MQASVGSTEVCMRKVIVQEFVSVDGLAAAADGSVDFIPASNTGDEQLGRRQVDFMDGIDAILLGPATYKMFAGYWPEANGDDKELADRINATPKLVFSSTLDRAPWGKHEEAMVVKERAEDVLPDMKRVSGKDMVVWGSIGLAQSLVASGLVDSVQLIVCPVVLGEGRRLFEAPFEPLTLMRSRAFDRGSVLLDYQVTSGILLRAAGASKEPLRKERNKRKKREQVREQSRRKPTRQRAGRG